MERFAREQAHVIGVEELNKITDEEIVKGMNPCMDRLVFMETRATEKTPRKLFPAYPLYMMEGKEGKVLVMVVVQYMNKMYNTCAIAQPVGDIGVKFRFWNLPPTEEAMDALPMVDIQGAQ